MEDGALHDRYRQNRDILSITIATILIFGILATLLLLPGLVAAEEQVINSATGIAKVPEFNLKAVRQTQSEEPVHPPTDLACRQCHRDTDSEIVFPSGERLPVIVDLEERLVNDRI